jgi:hypothetical protein
LAHYVLEHFLVKQQLETVCFGCESDDTLVHEGSKFVSDHGNDAFQAVGALNCIIS